jgi:pimeloyl-ACP methyl ester carboxylesterase/ADP-ribosylglycohydrolase
MRPPEVLFVHGSMHGAWVWDAVRALLMEQGITSAAIDLPGHGARHDEVAAASMASYSTAVVTALDGVAQPVVLVGHSMAGQVVARASFQRPELVSRLVLVNAQVLRDGETHESTLPAAVAEQYRELTAQQGGDVFRLPDEEIHRRWLQDLPFDDPRVTATLKLITPQPYRPLGDPAEQQDFASRGVPVTYVRSTADAGPPERVDGFVAKLPPGAEILAVPGAHDCMISEPGAFADVVAAIVRDPSRSRRTVTERRRLRLIQVADEMAQQGHDVATLRAAIGAQDADLDAAALALEAAPLRHDWEYFEPDDLASIRGESDAARSTLPLSTVAPDVGRDKIRAGFLGSVCGCILGKPVEFNPTLNELRAALEAIGEWPITDYISERVRDEGGLRMLHADWAETVRERIRWVAPDDDINYTIIGMLAVEHFGPEFDRGDLARLWLDSLPIGWTFGPERTTLIRIAEASLGSAVVTARDVDRFAARENPGVERCGAMIRVDAYGYAFPGDPESASQLAWRDATLTHRRTGVYGAMFAAAAIACAFVIDDPLVLARTALQYVPKNSRFRVAIADCIDQVELATDWLDGYRRINERYGTFGHCRVFQETGTLVNTLRFATDVGHGIGLQVGQGNDTDSYGATAGAILGVRFGTAGLEPRWLEPFHDRLHTTVATLNEPSLSSVADRISRLPDVVAEWRSGARRKPTAHAGTLGWMG